MFTIGEFSKITGLTVKTLRFYHEENLLIPSFVDPRTGYRHYDEKQIETARAVAYLRGLEMPLDEIKEMLRLAEEDEFLNVLDKHKRLLQSKIRQFRGAVRSLQQFIEEERKAQAMADAQYHVREKQLEPMLIGGIRMTGRYSDCGKTFAKIGKSLGRYIRGKPLLLHFDTEYRDDDANFEVAMPISQPKAVDGISVRELPGGKCVALLHKGPYEQMGHSYAKILKYIKEKGYRIVMPTREVYLKGPGMIFKRNPKNYLTEIEILVELSHSGESSEISASS